MATPDDEREQGLSTDQWLGIEEVYRRIIDDARHTLALFPAPLRHPLMAAILVLGAVNLPAVADEFGERELVGEMEHWDAEVKALIERIFLKQFGEVPEIFRAAFGPEEGE
jgi:hypothetical protein